MSDITIPAAALEAVFKVLYPYMDTGGDEKMGREVCADAIFAMIETWPGAYEHLFYRVGDTGGGVREDNVWCLPLPQEASGEQ